MTPEMMLAKMLSTKETSVEKTASVEEVDPLLEAKEKLAWADSVGRSLARRDMEKVAINPASALMPGIKNVAKTGLGKVMHGATSAGLGTRMGVGAGVGAAVGGVGGALKNPGVDPATGQQRSRMGNIMTGMAGGAALGAGAGAAAKRGAMALGSSNTRIGRVAGQSLKAEAGRTGNLAARQSAVEMQLGRGQRLSAAKDARLAKAPAPAAQPVAKPPAPAPAPQLTSSLTGLPAGTNFRTAKV